MMKPTTAVIQFPRQTIPSGGRVTLAGCLTTRGAIRFTDIGFGPPELSHCVLERMTIAGVDQLNGLRLGLHHGPPGPPGSHKVRREDVDLGHVVALACMPIELEISSHHSRSQEVLAIVVGHDRPSPFPICARPPTMVARLGGVERLACVDHAVRGGGAFEFLETWIRIRRTAPPDIRNRACGCLYWRAEDYRPIN